MLQRTKPVEVVFPLQLKPKDGLRGRGISPGLHKTRSFKCYGKVSNFSAKGFLRLGHVIDETTGGLGQFRGNTYSIALIIYIITYLKPIHIYVL